MNIVQKAITAIFGSKHKRDLKELTPYIALVNMEWERLKGISDDALREKTQETQNIINLRLKDIDNKIDSTRFEAKKTQDVFTKENLFVQIDKMEKDRNRELETVLLEVLPTAFAIVKETARRWKENGKLVVKTSEHDKFLKSLPNRNTNHIQIEGDTTTWLNAWSVMGHELKWEMMHYDVQIIGGVALHKGRVAEMATGEGKTLVATFPAFLNALAKRGVHIVTVNDYLAKRDSEWMAPIFEFHGLRVDCIDKHQPHTEARRQAYLADITYGTNNEFGFDYLRDNMANDLAEMVQRKHHYAMVDEVDSVLIDDARTPLIIAGPVPRGDEHEFDMLKPRIQRLVEAQQKIVLEYLNEARKQLKEGNEKEAGLPLFRAHRGLPKYKPLIKLLGEQGVKAIMQKTENHYLQDNQRLMPEADKPLYFVIDEKSNTVDLTEKGIDFITKSGEDPHFFIMPDIAVSLDAIEKDDNISIEEKVHRKETIINDYTLKAQRIHSVQQLLKAYTLFEKDTDYLIIEGEVKIVDEQTGRTMEGRRYSDGLHQALEAKENVRVQDATQTYATITLQNYFRMYHKLAGMTGTAETEATELMNIYNLDVVVVPTNKNIIRKDHNDLVYKTMREKYNAVIEEIVKLREAGRPVLVGTASVDISELVSRLLALRKIPHQVLNAKLHQKEAEIVAEAGKAGTVTIATNMAGRGTDIKLTPESKEAGGLAIIGTERHESRRVDRQLRGRSGRQGDPGSTQFFVSLEDNLMRLFGSERIAKVMDRFGFKEGEVIQHSMITRSIERAQKKVEENNFGIRKRLLDYDNVMNIQRENIYKRRKNALSGERLSIDISNLLADACEDIINNFHGTSNFTGLEIEVLQVFGIEPPFTSAEFIKGDKIELARNLYGKVESTYQAHNRAFIEMHLPNLQRLHAEQGSQIVDIIMPFTDGRKVYNIGMNLEEVINTNGQSIIATFEKIITLITIDHEWKEHLRDMDDLKESVRTAVHEQKDPLMVYKFEGYNLYAALIARINRGIAHSLMKREIAVEESTVQQTSNKRASQQQRPRLQEHKTHVDNILPTVIPDLDFEEEGGEVMEKTPTMPLKSSKIANRNDVVNVQYSDGRVVRNVKFKKIENDLKSNRCVLID
jgi:preprotein translocase subunit SecA